MLNIKALFSKIEARKLLWTNENPSENFTARDVTLPNVYDKYDYLEIVFLASTSDDLTNGSKVIEKLPCKSSGTVSIVVYASNSWYLRHRAMWWSTTGYHFDSAFYNNLITPATNGQNDAVLIPYKIYGIKKLGGVLLNSILKAFTPHREVVGVC